MAMLSLKKKKPALAPAPLKEILSEPAKKADEVPKPKIPKHAHESRKSKKLRFLKMMKATSIAWRYNHPLQIGIGEIIRDKYGEEYGINNLRAILVSHTRSKKYIEQSAFGGNRFNLTGDVAGFISDKEREYSFEALET